MTILGSPKSVVVVDEASLPQSFGTFLSYLMAWRLFLAANKVTVTATSQSRASFLLYLSRGCNFGSGND